MVSDYTVIHRPRECLMIYNLYRSQSGVDGFMFASTSSKNARLGDTGVDRLRSVYAP